ncbi:MAG: hypothetical protein ACK49H_12905 [Burkholderiales bacterium]
MFPGTIVCAASGSFTWPPNTASDSSRDLIFTYDGNTEFDDGLTSASLTVSARLYEVKAVRSGAGYLAKEVKLDD